MTLLALAAAFVLGVYLADRFDVPEPAVGLFLFASLLLLLTLVRLRRSPLPALLLVVLLLAMVRVEVFGVDRTSALAAYHSLHPLQLQGVVVSDPEAAGTATRFRLRVVGVMADDVWSEASGAVLVTARESVEFVRHRDKPYFRYGDELLLEEPLTAAPEFEDFDYPAFLARQGISSVMSFPDVALLDEGQGAAFYRRLYSVRRSIADSLARAVPEPQASLGQALVLGLRDNLPEDLVSDFRDTGTSHLLAISGLHLGVLLGVSLAISQGLFGRRRHYLVLPFVLMWLYALISGMSPSVTRAAIMVSVFVAALLLGRPRSILPAMGFAAAVMVAVNPNVLWSVSFQLSFAAMAGIALLAEPISRWIQTLYPEWSDPGPQRPVALLPIASDMIAMALAATVATLPLLAFHFERISLVGLPTTLLTLPVLPFVLATQAIAGLVGLVTPTLAQLFGWLAWVASAYLTGLVGLVARLPGAAVETGPIAAPLVWAYYGLLVLVCAWVSRRLFARPLALGVATLPSSIPLFPRGVPWWVLAPAVSIAALMWIAALSLSDAKLRVAFIDVGQGDAIFITTPGGSQVLVDGGPDPVELVHFLGRNMPFRDRTIELVVLTHAHSDHVNGLIEVLRRYKVEQVLEREIEFEGPSYQAWRKAVAEEGAEVTQAREGHRPGRGRVHAGGQPWRKTTSGHFGRSEQRLGGPQTGLWGLQLSADRGYLQLGGSGAGCRWCSH